MGQCAFEQVGVDAGSEALKERFDRRHVRQTSRTWRLAYVPQVPHAVCGSFGARQRSHATSVTLPAFHAERRWRVFERDDFRFGTAMSAFFRFGEQPFEGRPPGIKQFVFVIRFRIHSHAALRAQTEAVLVTQRNPRQC